MSECLISRRGGGAWSQYNVFAQPHEPETKDGLWIKTDIPMKIDNVTSKILLGKNIVDDNNITLPTFTFSESEIGAVVKHKDNMGNECVYFFNRHSGASTPLQKYTFITNTVTSFANDMPIDLGTPNAIQIHCLYNDKLYFLCYPSSYYFDFNTETFVKLSIVFGNSYASDRKYALLGNTIYTVDVYNKIIHTLNLDTLAFESIPCNNIVYGTLKSLFFVGSDLYIITIHGKYNPSDGRLLSYIWNCCKFDTISKNSTTIPLNTIGFDTNEQSHTNILPVMDKLATYTAGYLYFNTTVMDREDLSNYIFHKYKYDSQTYYESIRQISPFIYGALINSYGNYHNSNNLRGLRISDQTYYDQQENNVKITFIYGTKLYEFVSNSNSIHPKNIYPTDWMEKGKNNVVVFDGGFTGIKLIKNSSTTYLLGGCLLFNGENNLTGLEKYIGDGTKWIRFYDEINPLQNV